MDHFGDDDAPFEGFGDDTPFEGFGNDTEQAEPEADLPTQGEDAKAPQSLDETKVEEAVNRTSAGSSVQVDLPPNLNDQVEVNVGKSRKESSQTSKIVSPAATTSSRDEGRRGKKRGRTDPSMGGPTYEEGLFAPPSEPRRKGSNLQFLLALQKRTNKKRSEKPRQDSETSESEKTYSKGTPGRSDSEEPTPKRKKGKTLKVNFVETPEQRPKESAFDSDSDNLVINEDRKRKKLKKKSRRRIDSEREEHDNEKLAKDDEEVTGKEKTEEQPTGEKGKTEEQPTGAGFDSDIESDGDQERLRDSVSMAMQMLGSDDETEELQRTAESREIPADSEGLDPEPEGIVSEKPISESGGEIPPVQEPVGELNNGIELPQTTPIEQSATPEPVIKKAKGRKSFPRRPSSGPSQSTDNEIQDPVPGTGIKSEPVDAVSTPVPGAEMVDNVETQPDLPMSSTQAEAPTDSVEVRQKRIRKTPLEASTPNPGTPRPGRRSNVKIDINNPEFLKPFDYGFRRELVFRAAGGGADVYYFPPVGKKLRSTNDIADYLSQHSYPLTVANFTFQKALISGDPKYEVSRGAAAVSKFKNVGSTSASPLTPVGGSPSAPSEVARSIKRVRKTPRASPASGETPSGGLKVRIGRRPKALSGITPVEGVTEPVTIPEAKLEANETASTEPKNGQGREVESTRVPPLVLKKTNANQLWSKKLPPAVPYLKVNKPQAGRVYTRAVSPGYSSAASSGLKFILQDLMKESGVSIVTPPTPEPSEPPVALQEPTEQSLQAQTPAEKENRGVESPEKATPAPETPEKTLESATMEKTQKPTPTVPSPEAAAATDATPTVRKTISVRNASYLFPTKRRDRRSVRPPTRFLDSVGGKIEPQKLQPISIMPKPSSDFSVSPVKTPGVAPCTVLCSKARGQFPNLSCSKCLCLFHGICLGFSPLHSPGASFVCPSCIAKGDDEITEVGQHLVQHLSPADVLGHPEANSRPTVMTLKFDGNKFAVAKSASYGQPLGNRQMIRPAIRYIRRVPAGSGFGTQIQAQLGSSPQIQPESLSPAAAQPIMIPPQLPSPLPMSSPPIIQPSALPAPLLSAPPSSTLAQAPFIVKSVRDVSIQTEVEEVPPPKPPTPPPPPPPPVPLPVVGCQTIEHIRDRQNRLRRFIVISNIPVSEERPCPFTPLPQPQEPAPEAASVPEEPMEISSAASEQAEIMKEPSSLPAKALAPSPWSLDFANTLSYAYKGLLRVFSYLTPSERTRAGSVCKLWQKLANEPSLWGHVDTRKLKLKSLRNFFNRIRKLEIASVDLRGIEKKQRGSLVKYLNVPDVKKIIMCPCTVEAIEIVFRTCGDLIQVSADQISGTKLNLQDVKSHYRFEELNLECVQEVEVMNLPELQKLHKMKHLSLLGFSNLSSLKFMELMPRLEVLRLGNLTNLDEHEMNNSTTFRNVKNLKELRLENGPEWDSKLSLLHSFGSLEQLTGLELLKFKAETDLLSTLSLFPNLEQFLFMPVTSVDTSEIIFGDLLDHLPTLKNMKKFCLLLLDDCMLFDGTIVVRRETIERLNALKPQPAKYEEPMDVDTVECDQLQEGTVPPAPEVSLPKSPEGAVERNQDAVYRDEAAPENYEAGVNNVIDDPRIWASLENAQLSSSAIHAIESERMHDVAVRSEEACVQETPQQPNVLQNLLAETLFEGDPDDRNYEEAMEYDENIREAGFEREEVNTEAPHGDAGPEEMRPSSGIKYEEGVNSEHNEDKPEADEKQPTSPHKRAADVETRSSVTASKEEPEPASQPIKMPSIFDLEDEASREPARQEASPKAVADVEPISGIETEVPVVQLNEPSSVDQPEQNSNNGQEEALNILNHTAPSATQENLTENVEETVSDVESLAQVVEHETDTNTPLPSVTTVKEDSMTEGAQAEDKSMDVDFTELVGSGHLSESSRGDTDTQSPVKGTASYTDGDYNLSPSSREDVDTQSPVKASGFAEDLSETSRDNTNTQSPIKGPQSPREVTFKIGGSDTSSIFDETSKPDSVKAAVNNAVSSLFDIESLDEPAPSNVDFHRSEESVGASEPASEVSSFHEPQDENAHMGPPTPLQNREESFEPIQERGEGGEQENGIDHVEEERHDEQRPFASPYSLNTEKDQLKGVDESAVGDSKVSQRVETGVNPVDKDINLPCTVTPEELYEYFKLALPSVEVCVIRASEENIRRFCLDNVDWENNSV